MSRTKEIETFVSRAVGRLQSDDSESKANLARLRRAAGKPPEETPEVWSITMDRLPEGLSGHFLDGKYESSDAEWAIHNALTLYSVHAQGSTRSPQEDGVSFGKAVGRLARVSDGEETIMKRFNQVITSSDKTEMANHLRSMVQLMRSKGTIGFDYVLLAKDLYLISQPSYRNAALFRWGEDFYASEKNDFEDKEE